MSVFKSFVSVSRPDIRDHLEMMLPFLDLFELLPLLSQNVTPLLTPSLPLSQFQVSSPPPLQGVTTFTDNPLPYNFIVSKFRNADTFLRGEGETVKYSSTAINDIS